MNLYPKNLTQRRKDAEQHFKNLLESLRARLLKAKTGSFLKTVFVPSSLRGKNPYRV